MQLVHRLASAAAILLLLYPSSSAYGQNVIDDGTFNIATNPNASGITTYSAGASFGAWRVTAGNVEIQEKSGAFMNDPRVVGKTLDMSGSVAGAITQSVETRSGEWYTFSFKYTGNWHATSDMKGVEIGLGSQIQSVWYAKP